MKKNILPMIAVGLIAGVLAIGSNAINPSGIALVGEYAEIEYGADSVIIPPTAEEGDSPFITLKEAYGMFHDPGTIFLDARESEDFEQGHIRGAINLPFDSLDDHWADVEPLLNRDAKIVIYCSGTECDLSIHEARHLQTLGYQHLYVFFGGWTEWLEHDFPTDIY